MTIVSYLSCFKIRILDHMSKFDMALNHINRSNIQLDNSQQQHLVKSNLYPMLKTYEEQPNLITITYFIRSFDVSNSFLHLERRKLIIVN